MAVQDDERERELVRMFNLDWDPSHSRGGVDATLEVEVDGVRIRLDVEVKSTTGETVSTARDVGMEHMAKWRRKLFVIGFYSRRAGRPELLRSLCLTPLDMAPWIDSIERKIAPDFKIAELATRRLELQDVFDVCGNVTFSPRSQSYILSRAPHIGRASCSRFARETRVANIGSPPTRL